MLRCNTLYFQPLRGGEEVVTLAEMNMNTVEPPKRKTDKRTINTTTSIKNTMLKMLNDMSFERISVKELCERVGINRTTF